METIADFDKWLAAYRPEAVQFVAVFDPQTGKVISVGPQCAFSNEINQIPIDSDTAEAIISTDVQIEKCRIDTVSGKLVIAEIKTLTKLDDVLHRIISTEFATTTNADIFLRHSKKNKTIKIQLSAEYGGTKKHQGHVGTRKFIWDGSTEMNFFITDYNDPHLIIEMFSVKLAELVGKTKTIKNIDHDRFSVYTRRLFENYTIEHK